MPALFPDPLVALVGQFPAASLAALILAAALAGGWAILRPSWRVGLKAMAYQAEPSSSFGKQLIENLPGGVLLLDEDKIVFANSAATTLLADTGGSLLGRSYLDFVAAQRHNDAESRRQRILAEGGAGPARQWPIQADSGRHYLVQARPASFIASDGRRLIQIAFFDVTHLRRQEALLNNLVDQAPLVFFAIDQEGTFTLSRGAGLSRLGLSPGEAVGMNAFEAFPDAAPSLRRGLAGEEGVMLTEGQSEDGQRWSFWTYLIPDPVGESGQLYGFSLDITPRQRNEDRLAALAAENERLAAVVEAVDTGVLIADPHQPDTPIVFVNPAAERITGYSRDELLGHNCRFLQGPDTDRDAMARVREALAKSEGIHEELLNYRKDGTTFWNGLVISPIRNEKTGELRYFAGLLQDVTTRVSGERERLRLAEQLHQAQKNEAVGRLAGGVAHDFNNILANILGQAELVAEDIDDADLRAQLTAITRSAEHGRNIVQRLLSFTRAGSVRYGRIDLIPAIREALELIEPNVPPDIALAFHNRTDGPAMVVGDATQLQQALVNLALNALQAMGAGPAHLDITLTPITVDGRSNAALRTQAGGTAGSAPTIVAAGTAPHDASHLYCGLLEAGAYFRISVVDTGPGMAPETARRLFEPFFTTKPAGQGSGLGIPAAQGIVMDHGGALNAHTQPGEGTRLDLFLPEAPTTDA